MWTLVVCALSIVPHLVTSQAFTHRTWAESLTSANQLVAKLTLSEKVGIVTGRGQFGSRCTGDTHAVNKPLPNAQHGLPGLCLNDGPSGVRAVGQVTGFPSGINVASTFSRRLFRARGKAIAEENRAKGINIWLGPAMDLMRSPKAGRGWESFGPDPWLTGEASFETIQGAQSVGVQACAKHLLGNVQEHYRYTFSSDIDDRTVHEMYFWPFIRAIEANVSSIMCAYNRVNETYACTNEALIGPKGLLARNGFQGYVMSDWGATHPTTAEYANSGLDMEQPGDFIIIGGGIYGLALELAVKAGKVPRGRLDEMASRVLASWLRLGQDSGFPPTNFDYQHPDGSGPLNLNVSARSVEHTALAREIAGASAVLLKNEGALPLTGNEKRIAAIGLDILPPQSGCMFNGCNGGTVVTGWGSGTILYDFVVSPIDAIDEYAATHTSGTIVTSSPSNDPDAGVSAAIDSDVALVFVNAMSGELGPFQDVNGNFGDRNDLELWFDGGRLVERVAAVNKNTIVVIHSTGPVMMNPWNDSPNVTAIIYAGAPGEQTGPAIVDILYGAVNPSGRLPFTIAAKPDDYPVDIVYFVLNLAPTFKFTEGLFLDYRHFDQNGIKPLYEFGFGLSYTSFTYSELAVRASGPGAMISFTVTNSGKRDGTEIPQLYVGFPSGSGEPPKVLRGFDEIHLAQGESQRVTFTLTERDISIWNVIAQRWTRPSGIFSILVGASSRDIRLEGSL